MNLSELIESTNKEFKNEVFSVSDTASLTGYYVYTPFCYADGDGYSLVILQNEDGTFTLSDNGYSLFHLGLDYLSYEEIMTDKKLEALKRVVAKYGCNLFEKSIISKRLEILDSDCISIDDITNFICVLTCVDNILEFYPN